MCSVVFFSLGQVLKSQNSLTTCGQVFWGAVHKRDGFAQSERFAGDCTSPEW